MALPGVRWILTLQARLQDSLCIRASAACDHRINNFGFRVHLLVRIKQGIERSRFAAGSPIRKDFQLVIALSTYSRLKLACDERTRDQSDKHQSSQFTGHI